jgi:hypothetical protein
MPNASLDHVIRGLNEDPRGEWQANIMYRLYSSMVQGPHRQELPRLRARATVTVRLGRFPD